MHDDYTYFQDQEFRTSLAAYERMQAGGEAAELDAETLTDIAEFYAMSQRNDEANRCIQYALAFYPDSVDPKIFLARQQMFFGNLQKAWEICDNIAEQDDREVIFLRAELYIIGREEEKAYDLLLDSFQHNQEEDAAEFLYDSIGILKDHGLTEMALEWIDILRTEYPDYLPAIPLQAEIHIMKEENKTAIKLLDDYLHETPFDTQAWLLMSEALEGDERFDEALEAVDYVLAINSEHADALLTRGNILYDCTEIEEALKYYRMFLSYYPDDVSGICHEVQCLIDLKEYETAIDRLLFLLRHDNQLLPGYCYSYIAYCHDKLGHKEECLRYRKMAEKEPFHNLAYLFPDLYPNRDITPDWGLDLPY